MYLLDTNVVSELRKKGTSRIDPNVLRWEQSVQGNHLFLSVITVLELELGTRQLERRDPKQGAILRFWLDLQIIPAFTGRILPIDLATARRAAILHVPDPRPGNDALIAATALEHHMTVVTRNAADFTPTGVSTLNPWD